jgi:hypothetical protein
MSVETDRANQIATVEATLNYLVPTVDKPVSFTFALPPGIAQTTRKNDPHKVPIHDAWEIADQLSLDQQGFVVTHHESKVANFYDPKEVKAVFYPEVEELLKKQTGADKVVIFDHVVRNADKAKRHEDGAREYAAAVHNDYSLNSAPRRVLAHVPDQAVELLKHRFAEINVWRAISRPIEQSPLAICDAQSIDLKDVVATDLVYPHRVGETYAFTYNPAHRWVLFPKLKPGEAILPKCYDSKEDGRARFIAHTSFRDPTSPPNAPARESIELRALIFFAPEATDVAPASGSQSTSSSAASV